MDWNQYTYKDLQRDITNEFSSRFCVTDAITAVKRLKGEIPITSNVMFMSVQPQCRRMIHYLQEWNYQKLLALLIEESLLSENYRILCSPWLTQEDWKLLNNCFATMRKNGIPYEWREDGLLFCIPEPITDIVMCPTSQLHGEIMNALMCFCEYVDGGLINNVYQDFYSPSMFTQYSQSWVADHLGIQKNPYSLLK